MCLFAKLGKNKGINVILIRILILIDNIYDIYYDSHCAESAESDCSVQMIENPHRQVTNDNQGFAQTLFLSKPLCYLFVEFLATARLLKA